MCPLFCITDLGSCANISDLDDIFSTISVHHGETGDIGGHLFFVYAIVTVVQQLAASEACQERSIVVVLSATLCSLLGGKYKSLYPK